MMRSDELHNVNQLMQKLRNQPGSVRWKDLVSSPGTTHSHEEREQILMTGTAGHQAMAPNLYQGWQRPWYFWTALKLGLIIIAVCFATVYGCQILLEVTMQVSFEMLFLIPPMVIPLVLMIFFWEFNVPRNLTIWEILAYFLVGTMLSMGANALMFVLVGSEGGPMAALREEPAKLLAGLALIWYCSNRGKRICGLTGLVIGAAVGSGFSAFETISYGLHYNLETVMIRVCFAVVGHTLYSCSYLAAVALHSPDGKITAQSICNQEFLLTFGCSVFCHAFWNSSDVPLLLRFLVTLGLLWFSALWIIRKCMVQVLPANSWNLAGPVTAGRADNIEIRCLRGALAGKKWNFNCSRQVTIGRGGMNLLGLPEGIAGISRSHCCLDAHSGAWFVTDLHSSYGTYIQQPGTGVSKMVPGKQYRLVSGTILYLGSKKFCVSITLF